MRGVGETVLLLGIGVVGAGLAGTLPDVNADPAPPQPGETVLVDGAAYPVCAVEDCSDVPAQLGVWINSDGQWWWSRGEFSLLIEPTR